MSKFAFERITGWLGTYLTIKNYRKNVTPPRVVGGNVQRWSPFIGQAGSEVKVESACIVQAARESGSIPR
jgi:hypothetical protein